MPLAVALCPAADATSAGHESNVRIADVSDSELPTRASEFFGLLSGDAAAAKVDLALSRHNSLSERPAAQCGIRMILLDLAVTIWSPCEGFLRS